jgi:hypothetical protein
MRASWALASHLRFGDFEVGLALIDSALADEVLRQQLLVALQVGARNAGLRLGLLNLCALQRVIELHQQLRAPHALAVAEGQLGDAAADLGAQHHALTRTQRAHGLGVILQTHRLDPPDLHCHRAAGRRGALPGNTVASRAVDGRRDARLRRHTVLPPPGQHAGADQRNHHDAGVKDLHESRCTKRHQL